MGEGSALWLGFLPGRGMREPAVQPELSCLSSPPLPTPLGAKVSWQSRTRGQIGNPLAQRPVRVSSWQLLGAGAWGVDLTLPVPAPSQPSCLSPPLWPGALLVVRMQGAFWEELVACGSTWVLPRPLGRTLWEQSGPAWGGGFTVVLAACHHSHAQPRVELASRRVTEGRAVVLLGGHTGAGGSQEDFPRRTALHDL